MKKNIVEMVGTMVLCLGALGGGIVGATVALIAMVYMGGHISGANYNPAVSLGLFQQGKIDMSTLTNYIIFQVIGAALAFVIMWIVMGKGAIGGGYDSGDAVYIIGEIIGTFILVTTILHVAAHPKTTPNHYYGLAIGLALLAAGTIFSKGSFNPAIGLNAALFNIFDGGDAGDAFGQVWKALIGPLVGGYLAGMFYGYLGEEE